MAKSETSFVKRIDFLVDVIVVGAFFAFMFSILRSHVPSNTPSSVFIWAGLTAACMSGVFWMCCWMFRMVLRHQRLLKSQR